MRCDLCDKPVGKRLLVTDKGVILCASCRRRYEAARRKLREGRRQ